MKIIQTEINYNTITDKENKTEIDQTEKRKSLTELKISAPLDEIDCATYRSPSEQKEFVTFNI